MGKPSWKVCWRCNGLGDSNNVETALDQSVLVETGSFTLPWQDNISTENPLSIVPPRERSHYLED